MRIRLTVPKKYVDEDTLGRALEASSLVAQRQVESGEIPPIADAIEDGLVKWKPEPAQGFEGFDIPTDVLARGWADCDDLASWLCGELRASGVDPDAKPIVYQSGPKRWHAVVQRGDGSIDDPSRWAGMGEPGSPLPITTPIDDSFSTIGFARTPRGMRARLDVPLGPQVGVAIERCGEDAFAALGKAASAGFGILGLWGAPDEVLMRLQAIAHMLKGGDLADLAELHGCDERSFGRFVGALAERVGGTATFNPSMFSNLAASIIDPLGIRNLIAPVATEFVKSYASGLAQKTGGGSSSQATAPAPQRAPRQQVAPSSSSSSSSSTSSSPATVGASRGGGGRPSGGRGGRGAGAARGGRPSSSSSRSSSSGRQSGGGRQGSGGRQQMNAPPAASRQAQPQQGPSDYDADYGDAYEDMYGQYPTPSQAAWDAWNQATSYYAPQTGPAPGTVPAGWGPGGYFNPNVPPAAGYGPYPYAPGYYGAATAIEDGGDESGLVRDPYGGMAVPTAFSQYWKAWEDEQPRSVFDDQIMTGDDDADHDNCPPGWHWENDGGVMICVPN